MCYFVQVWKLTVKTSSAIGIWVFLSSGLLNPPRGKGNSNCFSLCVDQDKQQGLLLSKRLFSCSGGNISHHYNDEVVGIPNPGELHIVLRHEMDKNLSQQTDQLNTFFIKLHNISKWFYHMPETRKGGHCITASSAFRLQSSFQFKYTWTDKSIYAFHSSYGLVLGLLVEQG